MASSAEVVIRKTWITRIVPITAVIVVVGNSFRLAEKFPSALVWAVLIALNFAFLFLLFPKLTRKANQRLVLDDLGVSLTTGKLMFRCAWQDVSAIVSKGIDYSDRETSRGITIRCVNGRGFDLSPAWAISRTGLVQLLAKRCEAATGIRPAILNFDDH